MTLLRASATSLMPTRRFPNTIFFTFFMLLSLTEVDRRLAWGKFSTTSRPSLNALCHSNTYVVDRVDSPKHFCNIFNDSVAVIPLETHTNGRLPLKLHTTVKEGVTNLEKKLFTVSVYARGLTGRVRDKFNQMVYIIQF